MQTRYLYLLRFSLFTSDLLAVTLAYVLSFVLFADRPLNDIMTYGYYKNHLFIVSLLWVFCSGMVGLYRTAVLDYVTRIYKATGRTVLLHCFVFVIYLHFSKYSDLSAGFIVSFYAFLAIAMIFSRFAATVIEVELSKRYTIARPVAVLGKNRTGLRLASILETNQRFKFEGFLDEVEGQMVDVTGKLVPAICEEIEKAAVRGIRDVFVSLTPDRIVEMKSFVAEAERQCVRLRFVPDIIGSPATPFSLSYMGDFPVLTQREEPLENMENQMKKRLFDLLFSSFVIVFIMSWLVPLIGLLIKMESPGPVFFRQLRSGRNNQPFWCYKFRSMRVNRESDSMQAQKNDKRITRIGNFLRKTSLDEFPQFFNVLIGDMSIAGPRPHMLKHTEEYRAIIDKYMVRHFLKPGITGWAQVSGYRGETEDPLLMQKRVEHDIWYMERWSIMLDLKIVVLTVVNIFRGEENAR